MQENDKLNPEELQPQNLATLPVNAVELEVEEKIMEGVEDVVEISPEDLDKKNYVKISPTFYIQSVENEEEKLDEEGKPIELFKILNPETSVVETRELTDEEKREILIVQLKESKLKFKNSIHDGNVTHTKFGAAYKKKRQHRNKLAKASRKANR